MKTPVRSALLLLSVFAASALTSVAQQSEKKMDAIDLDRAHQMLHQTYSEVKKNYYDPTFHGVDLEVRFHEYDAKLDKVTSQGEGFRVIAAFLSAFHDSHLFFIPPPRPYRYDPGYRSQIIGDMDFVTRVRPGSDAADKIFPGDRIVHLNGYNVNRKDVSDMQYFYQVLAPAMNVSLDVTASDGHERRTNVTSQVSPKPMSINLDSDEVYQLIREDEEIDDRYRERVAEIGDVVVWKMAQFGASYDRVDAIFKQARQHKTLILDLRGNPGGRIETLKMIVGDLFDHDLKIFDEVSRKETKPIIAKSAGDHVFSGKLIVLIDSGSASCSELLSRLVQLEHRGTVIGDLSAGAVMESRRYPEAVGADIKVVYSLSITHANTLMSDGKSLEKVGVMPDERLLPTSDDLLAGKDPVLSHAIEEAGGKLDPASAGKLFPFEWPKI